MKKLYVTVTDEVYKLLEDYLSFFSKKCVGLSKSSVVNSVLFSTLSNPNEGLRALNSVTDYFSNKNLFKDDGDFLSLDDIRSVELKK